VPVGSLFRQGEGWAVFAVDAGHAHERAVELGQRNAQFGQILSGVDAGATVVMHPPDTLTDDSPVTIRDE
jgi:HlyD family secretion protein